MHSNPLGFPSFFHLLQSWNSVPQWLTKTMNGWSSKIHRPNGMSLPCLLWQQRPCTDPISQGISGSEGEEKSLLCLAPILWNILPLEVRSASAFMAFWKGLKTWLCWLVWPPQGCVSWRAMFEVVGWVRDERLSPRSSCCWFLTCMFNFNAFMPF